MTALVWNWHQPQQGVSDRPFYTRLVPASPSTPAELRVTHLVPGRYRLEVHRTGYRANDPLSAYIDMGLPNALSDAQLAHLQQLTRDLPEQDRLVVVGSGGTMALPLTMRTNDVT